jgi:hypothetical protein
MDYWRQSLLWTFHSWDILRTLFPPPTQSTQDWRVAEFRDYKTAWKWVQRTIEQKNHTLLTSSLPKSAGMIQETNGVCGEPRSIIGVRWSDPRGFARQGNHILPTSSLPKSAGMIQETNGVCGEPRSIIGVRWSDPRGFARQGNHILPTSSLPKSAGMIQETNGVCGEPRSIIGVRWSDPRGFARKGCRRKWTLEISYKCDSFHDIFVIVVWPFYPIFLPLPPFFFLTLFAEWIINDSFPKQQTDRQRNKRTNNPTNSTHISLSLWMSFIWTLKILWPN